MAGRAAWRPRSRVDTSRGLGIESPERRGCRQLRTGSRSRERPNALTRLRLPLISLLAPVLAAAVAPSPAPARPRMLVGLQDDPSLRWRPDRKAAFNLAQKAHTGIVRTTVYWSRIAETRPRDA